jgi:hypothetical protein
VDEKHKILALLLSTVGMSVHDMYGKNLDDYMNMMQDESIHSESIDKFTLQQEATIAALTEIVDSLPSYKTKPQAEKEAFIALYNAIIWRAPEASSEMILKLSETGDEIPQLEEVVKLTLEETLTSLMSSAKAPEIWNDSTSAPDSSQHLLYKASVKPFKKM